MEDITPDGRFLVFTSSASNLVPNDNNGAVDVFVIDLTTNLIERVSVDSNGMESDVASASASVSDDGQRICFQTTDDDLVSTDSNGFLDVLVRDRITGTTFVASVGDMEEQGNNNSAIGDISGNGRYVAFQSDASNLIGAGNDTNSEGDIFVRDLENDTTIRVSVADDESQATGGNGSSPSISDDGMLIAFLSSANNLIGAGNDNNSTSDVFVRDLSDDSTSLVSRNSAGTIQTGGAFEKCVISGNGEFVAFGSSASNLDPIDSDGFTDVFIRNLTNNQTSIVSVSSTSQNAGVFASFPTISQNGRFVGFTSGTGLDPRNTATFPQGHLRDTVANTTEVVDIAFNGVIGNGSFGSNVPVIANSGAFAFDSDSPNLVSPNIPGSNQQIFFVGPRPPAAAADPCAALKASLLSKIRKLKKRIKKVRKSGNGARAKKLKKRLTKFNRQLRTLPC